MNSSKRTPAKRLARFLRDLANLPNDPIRLEQFLAKAERWLPLAFWSDRQEDWRKHYSRRANWPPEESDIMPNRFSPDKCDHILVMQSYLRAIWEVPDAGVREWYVFELRRRLDRDYEWASREHEPPLPFRSPLPFEEALLYLLRSSHRTRRCSNAACTRPYFFAKRRSQKYCSERCALPAQREAKRKWWGEYGEKWRRKRQAIPRKKKKKRGR